MTPRSAKKAAPSKDATAQVRAYFAAQPPATRRVLTQIRETIRAAAPDAVEGFSYRIPCFMLDGRVLVYYAGWKEHTSLYPLTGDLKREFADELTKYETAKGTVRFPLAKRLPVTFVRRLVKARIAQLRPAKG